MITRLVATLAVGPAAFFALNEMTEEEIHFPDSAGEEHPPIYKRCYMILSLLKELGFLSVVPSKIGRELTSLYNRYSHFGHFDRDLLEWELEPINRVFTRSAVDRLVAAFAKKKFNGAYSRELFRKEVPHLCEYFKNGIAACELVDPKKKTYVGVSSRSLLNAGWLIEKSAALETTKLNAILDKALSGLFIKAKWRRVSDAIIQGN